MEYHFSFAQAVHFRSVVNCLRQVSAAPAAALQLYVHRNTLHVESNNQPHTSWIHFCFCNAFFERVVLVEPPKGDNVMAAASRRWSQEREDTACEEEPNDLADSAPLVGVSLQTRLLWRALMRALGHRSYNRCLRFKRMLLRIQSDSVYIQLKFAQGLVHETRIPARVRLRPSLSSRRGKVLLALDAATLLSRLRTSQPWLWYFPLRLRWQRRHSLCVGGPFFSRTAGGCLHSFEDISLSHELQGQVPFVKLIGRDLVESEGKHQRKEVCIPSKGFEVLMIDPRLPAFRGFTFSGREVRAAAQLCTQMNCPLALHYRQAGRPLVCCLGNAAFAAAFAAGCSSAAAEEPTASAAAAASGSPHSFAPHALLLHSAMQQQFEFEQRRRAAEAASFSAAETDALRSRPAADGCSPVRGWGGLLWISTTDASLSPAEGEGGESEAAAGIRASAQSGEESESDAEAQREAVAREFVTLLASINRSKDAHQFFRRQKQDATLAAAQTPHTDNDGRSPALEMQVADLPPSSSPATQPFVDVAEEPPAPSASSENLQGPSPLTAALTRLFAKLRCGGGDSAQAASAQRHCRSEGADDSAFHSREEKAEDFEESSSSCSSASLPSVAASEADAPSWLLRPPDLDDEWLSGENSQNSQNSEID